MGNLHMVQKIFLKWFGMKDLHRLHFSCMDFCLVGIEIKEILLKLSCYVTYRKYDFTQESSDCNVK